MKEKGEFNFRRVVRAALVGAVIGYMLYETGAVKAFLMEIERENQIYYEKCGYTLKEQDVNCPSAPPSTLHW